MSSSFSRKLQPASPRKSVDIIVCYARINMAETGYKMQNGSDRFEDESKTSHKNLTLKVLVVTIDAQWEGMGDVGSAR